jgi:hypothetical protein
MPLVAARANGPAGAYGWSAAGAIEELGGMVLITPTSITSTGTGNSSSIGANGSVEFSSCATLSLNGVFSATYDNYMVVVRGTSSDDAGAVGARLRVSTTDASGSNYTLQRLDASGTTVSGGRGTATYTRLMVFDDGLRSGGTAYVFGPYLAQPTAFRAVTASAYLDAFVRDWASTHSLSTSYDGITLANEFGAQTITGLVSVYGLKGA